jgi:hypothetical protein
MQSMLAKFWTKWEGKKTTGLGHLPLHDFCRFSETFSHPTVSSLPDIEKPGNVAIRIVGAN